MTIWAQTVYVVGALSAVLTIAAYVFPKGRGFHAAYVLLTAILIWFATYQSSELKRRDDAARQALQMIKERNMNYTHRGFVHASLAFLEKNKSLFPETYARANSLCKEFNCDKPEGKDHIVDLAFTFSGMVRGVGTLSE